MSAILDALKLIAEYFSNILDTLSEAIAMITMSVPTTLLMFAQLPSLLIAVCVASIGILIARFILAK